jgi:Na+/H+ antiporter NhaD/arsenite permease-like protein
MISVLVLGVVLLLISVRQIGKVRLQIWQIVLCGAFGVLATNQISFLEALKAINLDIILFLFGVFIVGQALEESGYLSHLSYKYFKRARSLDALVLLILFGMGFASAFLMNDTLAIIGTPVMLLLARKHQMHPQILLLALAFAITIGSVMSPIGNPQNLLIAIHAQISNPFIIFLKYLFIPTVLNLFFTYFLLKFYYKEHFHKEVLNHSQEPIRNHHLAVLSKISLLLILGLVCLKGLFVSLGIRFDFRLTYIALIGALPILIFSPKRFSLLGRIDWHTLIFFAAMFVLMESVWNKGFLQDMIQKMDIDVLSIGVILILSVILSQLISNVPLVALYLPVLIHAGASTKAFIALAAGSTVAGNLLIFGAASNVIIIHNAEKKAKETITFLEFAKIGLPLTLINVLVYGVFLKIS